MILYVEKIINRLIEYEELKYWVKWYDDYLTYWLYDWKWSANSMINTV